MHTTCSARVIALIISCIQNQIKGK
jgi:hypothetical protein